MMTSFSSLTRLALFGFCCLSQLHAQPLIGDNWRVRSPSPTGENLNSIVITPTAAVAVGNGTTLLTSVTASRLSWTASRADARQSIGVQTRAVYSSTGTKILLVAGTQFMQSTDSGTTWAPVSTNLPSNISIVALNAVPGEFMLVFDDFTVRKLATSTDGSTWTILGEVPNEGSVTQVTRQPGGIYVLTGSFYDTNNTQYASAIWSTNDGVTWNTLNLSVYSPINDVLWTGTQFVAVANGNSLTSTNGVSWNFTGSALPTIKCLAKGGSTLVALGESTLLTSTDNGTTWTTQTGPAAPFNPVAVAHDGSVWIAVGAGGIIYTSTNATTWFRRTPSGTIVDFTSIAHNGLSGAAGYYFAIGSDGNAWWSNLGTNWIRYSLVSFPDGGSVVWDGTQFVVVGNFFATAIDPDLNATSATGRFGPSNQTPDIMTHSAFAGGKHVAIGYADGTFAPVIYSGTAYNTFLKRTVPVGSGALQAVARGGSLWTIVGDNGTILTSSDGNSWTKRSAGANASSYQFEAVASNGAIIVAGGSQNYAGYYTSTNGSTWVQRNTLFAGFRSIIWTGAQFVAMDANGYAQTSTDGINWTPHPLPTSATITSLALNGTELLGVGARNTFISSDVVPEINFALASQSVYESSTPAAVTVTLSAASTATLTVPVSVHASSTAVLNTDYTALSASVTFLPGETAKTLSVPLLDDATLDGNKTLRILAATATGARLGGSASHLLTIIDNEPPPTVAFARTEQTVGEDATLVSLEVELSAPASAAVSVNLSTSGDASSISDYTAPSSVSFVAGERRKSVTITILDDASAESTETAVFTLTSPSGATLAASNTVFNLTIADNDSELTRWTLRQPKPTASGLNAIAGNGTSYVAVGVGGSVLLSSDGISWTQRRSGLAAEGGLNDVTFAGSQMIAVGTGGHVQTSLTGTEWTDTIVPGANSNTYLSSVASSGTRHVVVGETLSGNGTVPVIYSSADGIDWTIESNPIPLGSLFGVAWNGSLFVAVGNRYVSDTVTSTLILVSSDGRAWTDYSHKLLGVELYEVKAIGDKFIAFDGSKNCYVSDATGTTWTKRVAGTLGVVWACAQGISKTIGVGTATTSSTDLTVFNQTASPTKTTLFDITYAGGQFVAVGGTSTIYTSPDGVLWTKRSSGFDNFGTFKAATWAGTQFIAVGDDDGGSVPTLIATSPDGTTWTERANTLKKSFRSVAWNGLTAIAVGRGGAIAGSANGIAWAAKTSGTTLNLNSVIWARNQFVAVGGNLTGDFFTTGPGGAIVLTSPDGAKWTRRTVPTNQPLNSVVFTGSGYIAAGASFSDTDFSGSAVILTSPDGITWTEQTSGVNGADFTGLACDNAGLTVGVTSDGRIFSSSNGTTWTEATVPASPTGAELNSVIWVGNQFVAGNDEGQVFTSALGATWAASPTALIGGGIEGFAWNGQTLVAVGSSASIQTAGPGGSLAVPAVNFALSASSVSEAAGTATVLITLDAPPVAKATVTLGTQNPSSGMTLIGATADLVVPLTPIVFNPGETQKYLTITVKNDKVIEGPETIELKLLSVTGGATLGSTIVTHALTVADEDALPTVTVSPSALYVKGSSITLTATATGAPPLTYQWKKDGVPLPAAVIGSKSASMFIYQCAIADGGNYTCTVTNGNGNGLSATSAEAKIGVYDKQAAILNQNLPANVITKATQLASTNVVLHWFSGITEITTSLPAGITLSANRATLTIADLTTNSGVYICRVELPGVNTAPYAEANSFALFLGTSNPGASNGALTDATVGTYYRHVITTVGTADSWSAVGLPKGLTITTDAGIHSYGVISGFPEVPNLAPTTVTITAKNGMGTSIIKPTIVVNPLPAGVAGTHIGLVDRNTVVNDYLGGLITITAASNGFFTGAYTFGVTKASVVGRFVTTGAGWAACAADDVGSFPKALINGKVVEMSFRYSVVDPHPQGNGSLSITTPGGPSSAATFFAVLPLTGTTVADYAGRHTFALLQPSAVVGAPGGHGFGSATVVKTVAPSGVITGVVIYSGKVGDGTAFTASSPLNVMNASPLYASLYLGKGSVMGAPKFTLGGAAPTYPDSTIADNFGYWAKLPDTSVAGARNYPAGFTVGLQLRGSRYIAPTPAATAVVMGMTYSPGLPNTDLTFGVPAETQTNQLLNPDISINVKPGGAIETLFFNPRKVTFTAKPADGSYSGTLDMSTVLLNNVAVPRTGLKYEGQIVRIIGNTPEQGGYGFLTIPQLPDITISPMPAPTSTPILTTPVELKPKS